MTKQDLIRMLEPFVDEVEIYIIQDGKAFPQEFKIAYKYRAEPGAYLELVPTNFIIKDMIAR